MLLAKKALGKIRLSYASTNVTTSAWAEVTASIPETALMIEIFSSTGTPIKLSVASAGNEDSGELPFYVFPGGTDGLIPVDNFVKSQRLAAKAIDSNATTGSLLINLYGLP